MKLLLLFVSLIFCFKSNAQWIPTNGPYGYDQNQPYQYAERGGVLAIEKSGSNILAGVPGGIMLTSNNGNVWNKVLQLDSVYSFKTNSANIYAGTNNGFYISLDNGFTWTQANNGLTDIHVLSIAVSSSTIFAGTRTGVYVSTNNGNNWAPSNIGLPSTSVNAILVSGSNLFIGTSQGVYLSNNNGLTWTAVNNGIIGSKAISSFAKNGSNIFVGIYNGGKVYLTTNNGSNWTDVSSGLPSLFSSVVSNIGPKIFFGSAYGGIYETTNNGVSWTTNNNSFYGQRTFFSDGVNLYDGGYNGLNVTTDNGNTWTNLGLGNSHQTNNLVTNGTKIFAATTDGIYYTSDKGNSWNKCPEFAYKSGFKNLVSFNALAVKNTTVFAGSLNNGAYRSIDDGVSWTKLIEGNDTNITSLAFYGSKIFVGTINGMFSSTNNGNTWTSVTIGLPTNAYIFDLEVSGPVIFASTNSGLYLSTDGVNWTVTNSSQGFLASNGSNIYSTGGGSTIFISNNYGSNWSSSGVTPNYCGAADIAVKGDTIFLVGQNCSSYPNDGGAYISTNNGTTWNEINIGISDCVNIGSCVINGNDVYIGQYLNGCRNQNNGVFRAGILSLAVGLNELQFDDLKITIYPNPSSGIFTFKGLITATNVEVYDIMGRTVTSDFINTSDYKLDLSKHDKGIYIYKIVDKQNRVQQGKLLVTE